MTHSDRSVSVELRYHVQVWEDGGQIGKCHVHLLEPFESGRLKRNPGGSLCGRYGWYERPAEPSELICPGCRKMAERHGITIPELVRSCS